MVLLELQEWILVSNKLFKWLSIILKFTNNIIKDKF